MPILEPDPFDNLEELKDQADDEIQKLIAALPEDLRKLAEEVVCYLSDYCEEPRDNGFFETFGRQTACYPNMVSNGGAIVIYVGQIKKHCDRCGDDFLSFIRHVYMHELGHHLGIATEWELKDRGL